MVKRGVGGALCVNEGPIHGFGEEGGLLDVAAEGIVHTTVWGEGEDWLLRHGGGEEG